MNVVKLVKIGGSVLTVTGVIMRAWASDQTAKTAIHKVATLINKKVQG